MITALVLAGSRTERNLLCEYAGVTHKSLIRLGGRTLLERVIGSLREAGVGRIAVSTSHDDVIVEAQALSAKVLPAGPSPSGSVEDGARNLGFPLLVTTSDHALLKPEWVTQFLADIPPEAEIALLLAPEAAVRAAAPETQRSYLTFRDGRFSGCNLFYLRDERALAAIAVWRRVEAYRKQPWRIAALLGPTTLVSYALGRLTLDQAVERLGARVGLKAAAVRSNYGLCAVDVDKPSDLDLVRRLVEP